MPHAASYHTTRNTQAFPSATCRPLLPTCVDTNSTLRPFVLTHRTPPDPLSALNLVKVGGFPVDALVRGGMRAGTRKRKVETIVLSDSEDDEKQSRATLAKVVQV